MRGFRLFQRLSKHFSTVSTSNAGPPVMDKLGIAIFSSITLVAAGLGIWQLQRYDEKVLKIQDAKKKLKGEVVSIHPLEISQASLTASLLQHRNQQVNLGRGKYQHDKEVFLGLRPGPAGRLGPRAQGMATNPQGYYIVTPFVREEDALVVFVKRGWVPQKTATWSRPNGAVTLVGVASSCEKRARFSPVNDAASGTLIWLEARALLEAAKHRLTEAPTEGDLDQLVPVVELVDESSQQNNAPTLPVCRELAEFHEEAVSPLTHLTYSLTWFLLASAGAVMTFYKFRKPRRVRPARTATGASIPPAQ